MRQEIFFLTLFYFYTEVTDYQIIHGVSSFFPGNGPLRSLSYNSWIYSNMCNQCLSPPLFSCEF